MNVVISISILCLLMAFLASKNRLKNGLELCFILLAFIGAIHYNYGNDYLNYLIMFQDIDGLSLTRESLQAYFRDPGWIFLCYIFKPFGFFSLVIFLNIVQNFIFYKIIKTQVERKWWWLAVFIYVFTTNFYLLNFSMMRQGLAIALILASYFLITNRRFVFAFLLVAFAATLHSTSLIAVPFLVTVPFIKNNKFILSLYLFLFFAFFFIGDSVYASLLDLAVTDSLEEYSSMYQQNARIQFGVGLLVDLISLFVIVYVIYNQKQLEVIKKQLALFYCVTFLLIPLQSVNMMVGRLGYYFSVASLVVIPYFYGFLEKNIRFVLISLFMLITIYRYYLFFTTGAFAESYSEPFTTIFGTTWR